MKLVTPGELSGKQVIMDVAKRLFSVHGFHHTSLGDILDGCGLTKGAFYHHFKTKEELAIEILQEIGQEYQRELIAPAMSAGSPKAKLIALLDGIVNVNARPEWCNCQLMMTFSSQMSERDEALRSCIRQTHQQMWTLWRDLLAAAQEADEIPHTVSPEVGAQLIATAVTGTIQARKVGVAAINLNEVVEGLKEVILEGESAGKT